MRTAPSLISLTLISLATLGLAYGSGSAQASESESDTTTNKLPLHGAECLDPPQARGWTAIDDRVLLVDAGRRKYRIEVIPSCTALSYTHHIAFRGDPISGQVCGGLNDAVITRDYPCHIQRMELLSKEQYKQALKEHDEARKASRAKKSSALENAEENTKESAETSKTETETETEIETDK